MNKEALLESSKVDRKFTIDDVEFVIDISQGYNRRQSEVNSFTLVKSPAVLEYYFELAGSIKPKHILELGVFQGGSFALIDKLFNPHTLIGVELAKSFSVMTEYTSRQSRNVNVYFETSQADESALEAILNVDFAAGLDLVVDDASHAYKYTKKSFELVFPKLSPGGLYIIEDWAWSHNIPMQDPKHSWHGAPALTNLLFELIIDLGENNNISSITIDKGRATIVKKGNTEDLFAKKNMRSRVFNHI